VDVQIHIFLTWALVGGEWSASRPCHFTPGERAPGTHWVDTRASLDELEKRKFLPPPGLKLRPIGRPVRSQSLYRLRYPSSFSIISRFYIQWNHNFVYKNDSVAVMYVESVARVCNTHNIELPRFHPFVIFEKIQNNNRLHTSINIKVDGKSPQNKINI
jgi:hypothetical protein